MRILTRARLRGGVDGSRGALGVDVPSFRVDVTREIDLSKRSAGTTDSTACRPTFPALAAPQAAARRRGIAPDRAVRAAPAPPPASPSRDVRLHRAAAAAPVLRGREPAAIANPLSEKFAVLRPRCCRVSRLVRPQPAPRTARRPAVRDRQPLHRRMAKGAPRHSCGAARRRGRIGQRRIDRGLLRREGRHRCAGWRVGARVEYRPAEHPFLVAGRAADAHLIIDGGTRRLGIVGHSRRRSRMRGGFVDADPQRAAIRDCRHAQDPGTARGRRGKIEARPMM